MSEHSDTLTKPDMVAVLSRTHIGKDLHSFLLPVLEAVSNAMHGIEDRFGDEARTKGMIRIKFEQPNDPAKILISITDNGVGLTEENYKSFKTPFSGHKLKQRGRGFGRFIAFKIFSRILYSSRYEYLFDQTDNRCFRFDVNAEEELVYFDGEPDFESVGLCVEYNNPLKDWHELIRTLDTTAIADEIGSHFLPQFLYGWLPQISIQFDDQEPENITAHFKDLFVQSDSGELVCEVDGETENLNYSITKIAKTRSFKNHCLLFSAADRIVGAPKDLTNKLGQPHFTDENGDNYVIVAVVSGEIFEQRLNDARTGINISPKSIEKIVSAVSSVVESSELKQIQKIKDNQIAGLTKTLQDNPILKLGLRGKTLEQYVEDKPNNWDTEEFVKYLAVDRVRANQDLHNKISNAVQNPEGYVEQVRKIVDDIDTGNKEALAEYVIHRKHVIELVEAARKHGSDGKHPPEDVIHDLIFRRFSDNVDLDYFDHNLWLIDDALAFLPYISSDRSAHGKKREKGDKIADLVFFDDSMVLGDDDGSTLSIVEFKKPSRNDYRPGSEKHDPVEQVIKTLEKATADGGIQKSDGTFFSFTGVMRRFAYIIADPTPSFIKVMHHHDFLNDANPKVFTKYRNRDKILIQAFGYDTLVENAKKRNQAFFTVLLGES